jgi:hypothetical protein
MNRSHSVACASIHSLLIWRERFARPCVDGTHPTFAADYCVGK